MTSFSGLTWRPDRGSTNPEMSDTRSRLTTTVDTRPGNESRGGGLTAGIIKRVVLRGRKRAAVELRFVNSDTKPKVSVIQCDKASIPSVMAWYGAYFAGDRYAVFADGQKLEKDRNGELIA